MTTGLIQITNLRKHVSKLQPLIYYTSPTRMGHGIHFESKPKIFFYKTRCQRRPFLALRIRLFPQNQMLWLDVKRM